MPMEPIPLVAHAERERRAEGARGTVEVEPLEPVLTVDDALAARGWSTATTTSSRNPHRAATWRPRCAAADLIVEGEYRSGHQEQLYIENNGDDRRARRDGGWSCAARCSAPTTCTRR